MDGYQKILQQYWGYDDFRGIQREIIESIGAGRDTLGLMPTGGGKSITFQVPALAQKGVCVVITPLISLMKDQVDHLRSKGIQAAAIHSGMRHDEVVQTLDNAVYGGLKLLYVSPERLASELFQIKLSHMKVSFITVDEAHCISQWGYDFRPSYLQIASIRKIVPHAPVLALTATATSQVIDDIQEQLGFNEKNVFRMSFSRANLIYIVRQADDKEAELIHILTHTSGPAIVYARSRQRTKDVAKLLVSKGLSATFYHAGLEPADKEQRQDDWQKGQTRIMVATNAFGMGIDKADVEIVVHMDPPNSLEEYFQEAGRAGRNGQRAYAVMLYNPEDQTKLHRRATETFPEKEVVREIYDHLAYFYEIGVGSGAGTRYEFSLQKFSVTFRHFPIQVDSALQILQRAGYLLYEPTPDSRARIRFLLSREDLYRLEEGSPQENSVITTLLRSYGGLFSDYVYVDESFVAKGAGLDKNTTYAILKSLSKRKIIDFVPRKNIPLVTYVRDRVDGDEVIISREVYEDRLAQFEERIKGVLHYCTNNEVCRSRQLLRYFGETKTKDCGHCDVCIAHRGNVGEDLLSPVRQAVMTLLNDGQEHPITELRSLPFDSDMVDQVLENLLDEEEIILIGSKIKTV